MTEELKSCPYCGGEANVNRYHADIDDVLFPGEDNDCWYVSCSMCRASSWYDHDKKQAIAAWNTRDCLGRKLLRKFKACVEYLARTASERSKR